MPSSWATVKRTYVQTFNASDQDWAIASFQQLFSKPISGKAWNAVKKSFFKASNCYSTRTWLKSQPDVQEIRTYCSKFVWQRRAPIASQPVHNRALVHRVSYTLQYLVWYYQNWWKPLNQKRSLTRRLVVTGRLFSFTQQCFQWSICH